MFRRSLPHQRAKREGDFQTGHDVRGWHHCQTHFRENRIGTLPLYSQIVGHDYESAIEANKYSHENAIRRGSTRNIVP
jgi:hypothetical protein